MANRFRTILRRSGWRIFLKGSLTIFVLVLIGYFANSIDFEATFKSLPFSTGDRAEWYRGPIGFALFSGLLVAISCPRQVVSFFAAYFFGLWSGFFAAWAGTFLGCLIGYCIARMFQRHFREFVRGKLDIALQFWKDNAFIVTVLWRLLPAGSNFLTNLAAGAFAVPALRFFTGSAVGYIPQTFIFALIGSGVKVESTSQILISVLLFVIAVAAGLFVVARYRKKLKGEG